MNKFLWLCISVCDENQAGNKHSLTPNASVSSLTIYREVFVPSLRKAVSICATSLDFAKLFSDMILLDLFTGTVWFYDSREQKY